MSLADRLIARVLRRDPDFVIGGQEQPYLRRWWLIPRNRFFNVYLHQFIRSDDDRALHDHPWWNVSILLRGRYREHRLGLPPRDLRSGRIVFRRALAAHRVELTHGQCWTLFLTGPRIREWGFLCPQGWRHWREFTSGEHGQTIGKGCDP